MNRNHVPTRKLSAEKEEEAVRMYTSGQKAVQVARHFGVHVVTLRKTLRLHGVRMRGYGKRREEWSQEESAAAVRLHEEGFSLKEIAAQLSSSAPTVSRVLAASGVVLRRAAMGQRHGQWKGGRFVQGAYARVLVPLDSPFAVMCDRAGYVLEHRLVMAQSFGRPLRRNETVHHIDGDGLNNAIENLQLRHGNHGKGVVVRCLDCGSCNIGPVPIAEHEAAQ